MTNRHFIGVLENKFANDLGLLSIQELKDYLNSSFENWIVDKIMGIENNKIDYEKEKKKVNIKSVTKITNPVETF